MEKDGIIMYNDKMYNIDIMNELEIDLLIQEIELKQQELENKILEIINEE